MGRATQICTISFPQQGSKSQFSNWLNERFFVVVSKSAPKLFHLVIWCLQGFCGVPNFEGKIALKVNCSLQWSAAKKGRQDMINQNFKIFLIGIKFISSIL